MAIEPDGQVGQGDRLDQRAQDRRLRQGREPQQGQAARPLEARLESGPGTASAARPESGPGTGLSWPEVPPWATATVAVSCVLLIRQAGSGTPPTWTVVVLRKLVPLMVSIKGPAPATTEVGLIELTVGACCTGGLGPEPGPPPAIT